MKVGVLGGGQLARMLAQAGRPLGVDCMFLCPDPHACAMPFGKHLCVPFDDLDGQRRLVEWADVVTYEFENVPVTAVESLERQRPLYPPARALAVARDRLLEKRRFRTLGLATAEFTEVDSLPDLINAAVEIGLPAILKSRVQGYDGKGQVVLRHATDLRAAWERIGKVPCILESLVAFDRELSIIAARARTGTTVFYPLSENRHRDGLLRLSRSRTGDAMQGQAEWMVKNLDWNDPLVTKGQRMSEFLTVTGLAHFLREYPDRAPKGLANKLNEWAKVVIRRSDNLLEVVGLASVQIVDGSQMTRTSLLTWQPGQPFEAEGLRLVDLPPDHRYDQDSHCVLPPELAMPLPVRSSL